MLQMFTRKRSRKPKQQSEAATAGTGSAAGGAA
jgi:hypothetical protein